MEPYTSNYALILIILSLVLGLITLFICQLLPNRWIWIGIICGFLAGLLAGIERSGLPCGVLIGGILGIGFDLIMVPSGLLTKYYARKGWERINNINKLSKK